MSGQAVNGHTLAEIERLAKQATCLTCGHELADHVGQGCAACRCDRFNRLDPNVSPKTTLALLARIDKLEVVREAAKELCEGVRHSYERSGMSPARIEQDGIHEDLWAALEAAEGEK